MVDGSASRIKSRDNSNLKSRGSQLPFTTEHSLEFHDNHFAENAKLINQQIYRENDDPLNFTICRTSENNGLTSQIASRNKALNNVEYANSDTEGRKKMLTQSDDKYKSNKRASGKMIN